ncbi:MAG: hypothetical protein ABIO79_06965 [Ferruginibacter sp.]
MKYLNLTKNIAIIAVVSLVFMACKKANVATPLGDAGQTLVKIMGAGTPPSIIKSAIDFVPSPTKLLLVELRRDVPNETELNRTMTVTIKDDTAAVGFFNRDTVSSNPNRTNPDKVFYNQLPTSWYTIQTDGVKTGGQGGTYTFTFLPGQFAKEIYVTIPDATVMNPSALYALAFTITSADANGVISTQKSIIREIGAKNAYDGVYTDDFCNYHPSSNPGYTCSTTVVHMITTGANKVKMFWPLAGAFGNPAVLGGSLSYFGAQEPEYTINTATNAVTVQNAAAGASTFYNMAAGFNSRYDAPTKTFYVKFGYNNPGGVFDPAATREWTITLKYTGPR